MNEIVKPKRKPSNVERIALGPEAVARLDRWLEQLTAKYHGLKVKRSELAEWIVLNHAASLDDGEIRQLGDKFYDQVHLAQWILRQLKEAKAAGKEKSIAEIMGIVDKS